MIYELKSFLINDMKEFSTKYTENDDQTILNSADINKYSDIKMKTRSTIYELHKIENVNHPFHLNYFRAIYLFTVNYLLLNEKAISEGVNRNELERFFSNRIFAARFMKLVDNHNSSNKMTTEIDRQKGLDYRNGINNVVSNSMIAQFSMTYIQNPNNSRNKERPFIIKYKGERGIDAGGLMRDFFTELITDIKTPRVGLFIQTPNGRNHEGKYQDCIVPAPAPEISNSKRYYISIGALIAIAIRTEMRQPDLVFPDFFWSFIISGKLKIDDIYDIDDSYKSVTTNLLLSANEMTDEEFENLMSSASICNLRGNPITIDIGNRRNTSSIRLSKSNCARFIAICDEFRLNELSNPLSKIREGFWQNLAIDPPPFITASLLELLACGDRIISLESLRSAVQFHGVPETQINYFWQVVARMNNDERKKLIHFSTGLNSLTNRGLRIDFLGNSQLDHLPTASTCFFSLHLPPFSSVDRMYNAFILAINETGTFELS